MVQTKVDLKQIIKNTNQKLKSGNVSGRNFKHPYELKTEEKHQIDNNYYSQCTLKHTKVIRKEKSEFKPQRSFDDFYKE